RLGDGHEAEPVATAEGRGESRAPRMARALDPRPVDPGPGVVGGVPRPPELLAPRHGPADPRAVEDGGPWVHGLVDDRVARARRVGVPGAEVHAVERDVGLPGVDEPRPRTDRQRP